MMFATGIIDRLMFSVAPPRITQTELNLLSQLIAENAVGSGEQLTRFVPGGWYLGSERLSAQLCFRLIRHCFISMDGEESGGVSYWRANEMGRMAVDGKTLAEINAAVR